MVLVVLIQQQIITQIIWGYDQWGVTWTPGDDSPETDVFTQSSL